MARSSCGARSAHAHAAPAESTHLGTSANRPASGKRLCVVVPVTALEPGATEFRLRSLRPRRRAFVASSEADKLDLGPIATERWMDFVCPIRWVR